MLAIQGQAGAQFAAISASGRLIRRFLQERAKLLDAVMYAAITDEQYKKRERELEKKWAKVFE